MVPAIRLKYNNTFTDGQYRQFLQQLAVKQGTEAPPFRVAETPVFVPKALGDKLLQAGEDVINTILQPDFKTRTEKSIPKHLHVPGENAHSHFLIVDFGICLDENGELTPRLIELQGFPSLFAYQELMAQAYRDHFYVPEAYHNFFNGFDRNTYFNFLRDIIVGPYDPQHVILLEVLPHQQKTRVDFYYTGEQLGIPVVCVTELIHEGKKLFYLRDGVKTSVKRIYNRVIFEDLERYKEQLGPMGHLFHELDVEWIPHPNWFYRISKYTLPMINSAYAPKSWFLHELPVLPKDLDQYVLKPLFSFAGSGVKIDVTPADIDAVKDPENWILQQKVHYAPVVQTPEGNAICEIRLMYGWPEGAARPVLMHNLARLSKGRMIGVGFNDGQTWVGGSCAFFEP
ncbi:hypothetical protein MKQ68_13470 [Chitinophaga horti]|uniref:Circularly permuted type 2 ATP-grasp protein n=1 Tax=Chitinophaga horti TaxID=2920382 RepID=A0ABY6IUR6_9BACT|nr:hypothetical protein [Chitinophaga horti]UYQ91103.1 hypothetical protein MKQ68_13470 [Chitinophaga horti]